MERIAILLFSASFIVLGVWVISDSLISLYKVRYLYSWSTVEGTVLNKGLSVSTARISGGVGSYKVYFPKINYSYIVDGSMYQGNNVFGLNRFKTAGKRKKAEIIVRETKDKITVYYNPDNNDESVIYPDVMKSIILPLVIGVLFALFGIGILFYKLNRREL